VCVCESERETETDGEKEREEGEREGERGERRDRRYRAPYTLVFLLLFSLGLYSLVQKSATGVTTSAAGVFSSLGSASAHLSFDKQYIRERSRKRTQQRPTDLLDGMRSGITRVGMGLVDGVIGVVKTPYEKTRDEGFGVESIGVGVVQGIVGLVAKPVAGVLDGASDIIDGVGRALPSINQTVCLLLSLLLSLPFSPFPSLSSFSLFHSHFASFSLSLTHTHTTKDTPLPNPSKTPFKSSACASLRARVCVCL